MSGEFVQQYSDAVDAADALEMRLDLFGAGTVVYVANEDTSRVDIFFAFAHLVALVVDGLLHLAQLLGLVLHLLHAAPHCGDLFLYGAVSPCSRDVSKSTREPSTNVQLLAVVGVYSERVGSYLLIRVFRGIKTLILFALLLGLYVGHDGGCVV